MNPYHIALISFACIFGGALGGLFSQRLLPAHHLTKDSLDSVKLGAGLIATMAALILGLLVSSSKGTYDRINVLINEAAANTIDLDRTLASSGPGASEIRRELHDRVLRIRNDVWQDQTVHAVKGSAAFRGAMTGMLPLMDRVAAMEARDEAAVQIKANALRIASDLNRERWQIAVESRSKLPLPLVAIPVLWITFLTFVYGAFAPRNATVATVLLCCSLSIAGAIFLICEMSAPLDGSIKIPSQPLDTALEMIGH
jgi:hypothetical protein